MKIYLGKPDSRQTSSEMSSKMAHPIAAGEEPATSYASVFDTLKLPKMIFGIP